MAGAMSVQARTASGTEAPGTPPGPLRRLTPAPGPFTPRGSPGPHTGTAATPAAPETPPWPTASF